MNEQPETKILILIAGMSYALCMQPPLLLKTTDQNAVENALQCAKG